MANAWPDDIRHHRDGRPDWDQRCQAGPLGEVGELPGPVKSPSVQRIFHAVKNRRVQDFGNSKGGITKGRLTQWRLFVPYVVLIILGMFAVTDANRRELFVGGLLTIGFVVILWVTHPPSSLRQKS